MTHDRQPVPSQPTQQELRCFIYVARHYLERAAAHGNVPSSQYIEDAIVALTNIQLSLTPDEDDQLR